MSKKLQGITVEVGGNTTELNKALSASNKEAQSLTSEIRAIDGALKLDPSSVDLITKKQKLLKEQVENTKSKLDTLKVAQQQFVTSGGDINSDAYREMDRMVVQTETSLKGLINTQSGLSAHMESFATKADAFGDKSTSMGKSMLPVTAAIGGAAVASIKFASDTSESLNKVQVAFGDSSGTVEQFAQTTLASYGIARGTALEMTSLFGDMATSMGMPRDEAANMSTSLTGLAGDLASFKNIGVDEAMTALNGVFTGETESLKRLGVIMTEANLNAYALEQGIGKTTQEMTQAEKVQLRYNYVMQATANAQGDFARTSDGTANSMRITTETLKELASNFGEILLPIITPLIQKVNDLLKSFAGLSPEMKKTVVMIGGIVAAIGPTLIIIGKLSSGMASGIRVIGVLQKVLFGTANSVGILSKAMAFLTSPFGIVVAAAAALAVAMTWLYNNNESFKKSVDELISRIMPVLQSMWNSFSKILTEKVLPALSSMWEWFQENIIPVLITLVETVIANVLPVFEKLWTIFKENIIPVLIQLWELFVEHIIPVFVLLFDLFVEKILPILQEMVNMFITYVLPVLATLSEFILGTVIPVIMNLYVWFAENLLPIIMAVAVFIVDVFKVAFDVLGVAIGVVSDCISTVIDWFASVWKWLEDVGVIDAFAAVWQGLSDVLDAIIDSLKWIGENASNILEGIGDFVGDVGGGIGDFVGWLNPFDSGGFGEINRGGSLSLQTNINVTNNGTPISASTIRQWGNTITDIVDENLGRRGR